MLDIELTIVDVLGRVVKEPINYVAIAGNNRIGVSLKELLHYL